MKILYTIFLVIMTSAYCNSQNLEIKVETNSDEKLQEKILETISNLTVRIDLNKDNPDAELINQRGMLFFANKEYENAKTDFEKVIDLNASHLSDAYYWKGLANFMLGVTNCDDFQKAKDLGYEADWGKLNVICPGLN